MAEEKKPRIVIASVLKPFDEVRMFEKIGRTLARENVDVHSIGWGKVEVPKKDRVTFHGLGVFPRMGWKRLMASFKVLKKVLELKPTHFIITTHELLFAASIVKRITGARVIYDVQENYYLNILHTDAFPLRMRKPIAWYVRRKEIWFANIIDHFLLAESIYANQLPFIGQSFTILENTIPRLLQIRRKQKDNFIDLVFTGTLSESTGVFIALELAEKLHELDNNIRLTLIGFAPASSTLEKIMSIIKDKTYIILFGGDVFVSHDKIIEQIENADFGIISYPHNISTRGRIPTKLREYVGYRLPYLVINNPELTKLTEKFNAGIHFHNPNPDLKKVLSEMRHGKFFGHEEADEYWESQETKLTTAVLTG